MLTNLQIIARIALSGLLGGLVGIEREKHKKIAGLRTHILVCVGSCLGMLTSIRVYELYQTIANVDPSRIAAGVITGIGFLGAGTIIRSRSSVSGLTTAASLWTVSVIGLSMGCGFFLAGIIATLIVLFDLYVLRRFNIGSD